MQPRGPRIIYRRGSRYTSFVLPGPSIPDSRLDDNPLEVIPVDPSILIPPLDEPLDEADPPIILSQKGNYNSEGNAGVDGDDCAAFCEDNPGNEGFDSDLGEDTFVDVEICENIGDDSYNGDDNYGDNADVDNDSDSDFADDAGIPDPLIEDDEEIESMVYNHGRESDEILALGKTFCSSQDFKYALLKYSLKTQYDIKMYKSSAERLGAKCTDPKCPWRVYCSFEKGLNRLMVKVMIDNHICTRSGYTKMLKGATIAKLYEERLRVNPKISPTEMVDEIKREYNFIVTVHQCWRAKKRLADKRKSNHEAQFARIWDYQEEILNSNRGSTMEVETILGPAVGSKQRFSRLYICFGALKSAWRMACRPIIGLDGAFLKWDVKGQLLAAVGRDGDNRIFPIAWAVVEVENEDNWTWFVQLLRRDLSLGDGADITIISDKCKGLLNAVQFELPKAEHRMCARHILENWKKTNKDINLERLFWKIARSYTSAEFAEHLEALNNYNQGAYDSLQRTRPTTWSRVFFKQGSCCNDNLNNLSESFNRNIRESRKKPLLDMLEDIRRKCMVRNTRRAIKSAKWMKKFTPRVDAEIEKNRQLAKDCIRYITTGNLHEIDYQGNAYRVDMDNKTCGCGYWQLNGIPCMHVMSVITTTKLSLDAFVSDYHTTARWRQLYRQGMKPVQGMKLWPRMGRMPVLPPASRINRGRPNQYPRKKGPHESASNKNKLTRHGRVQTCSNCKREGHNKSRCPNATVGPPPKRPRGRPRKDLGESSQGQYQGPSQGPSQAQSQGPSQAQSQSQTQAPPQVGSQGLSFGVLGRLIG